ncbi:hypothetical protein [Acetilactobacillus jinshanensis]|uniref:Uncharacterized protein n=1 Tax=Acetilactobacillus jinshanensis TaxID=1720083 RepID=A0A4P6ZIY7_9LACO|nr:hypothetical protein [Acetilactobacillus jinshanensis]QBP17671.1 hypothetical protein ELX58_00395 [Acetilactobacillus jinshanensis]URL61785.1 hypothetical protein HGK75_07555 [uncultured bacterium]
MFSNILSLVALIISTSVAIMNSNNSRVFSLDNTLYKYYYEKLDNINADIDKWAARIDQVDMLVIMYASINNKHLISLIKKQTSAVLNDFPIETYHSDINKISDVLPLISYANNEVPLKYVKFISNDLSTFNDIESLDKATSKYSKACKSSFLGFLKDMKNELNKEAKKEKQKRSPVTDNKTSYDSLFNAICDLLQIALIQKPELAKGLSLTDDYEKNYKIMESFHMSLETVVKMLTLSYRGITDIQTCELKYDNRNIFIRLVSKINHWIHSNNE